MNAAPDIDLSRIESVMNGDTFAGLHYDSELVSSAGVRMTLFALPDTTAAQIKKAKSAAKNARDVVYFNVVRIEPEMLPPAFRPDTAAPVGWISSARWIVQNKTARRVDIDSGQLVPEGKSGGTLLDLFSASAMVQVYDALNETNRDKFNKMSLPVAHHIAFAAINRDK